MQYTAPGPFPSSFPGTRPGPEHDFMSGKVKQGGPWSAIFSKTIWSHKQGQGNQCQTPGLKFEE